MDDDTYRIVRENCFSVCRVGERGRLLPSVISVFFFLFHNVSSFHFFLQNSTQLGPKALFHDLKMRQNSPLLLPPRNLRLDDQHTPHGAKVIFDKVEGRAGWLTPPGVPFVEAVLASRQRESVTEDEAGGGQSKDEAGGEAGSQARGPVLASNPGFSPIPSAFFHALSSSAVVVGLGVNDPEVRTKSRGNWRQRENEISISWDFWCFS